MTLVHACVAKDLTKRTILVETVKQKAYQIAKNLKWDRYQRAFAIKVFDKKIGSYTNETLTPEIYKLVITKFKRKRINEKFTPKKATISEDTMF